MTTAQDTFKDLSTALKQCGNLDPVQDAKLIALIDAFPPYLPVQPGDNTDIKSLHRIALANLLECSLPNDPIAPEPSASDPSAGSVSSSYAGTFSGYQSAFFGGIALSDTARAVATQVQIAQSTLDSTWWANYAVTILTDAIRMDAPGAASSVNTSQVANDLHSRNKEFLPALSASYLAVFTTGYTPTVTAITAIGTDAANCLDQLTKAILNGQFTANVIHSIKMVGDAASATLWLLFNLWITLQALGESDVDSIITKAIAAGLPVPSDLLGPGQWWSGGYTSWYMALSGSDVAADAADTMQAGMPEIDHITSSDGTQERDMPSTLPNGYATSFCCWSTLNRYYSPPQQSSCFGKGTRVLMADGSTKAIEAIQIGDEIRTDQGNKKVILVSSPKRFGRSLYQINRLDVFATAAHPFRASQGANGQRLAVDPWALIDNLPNLTANGVSRLTEGVGLAGLIDGRPADIPVESLIERREFVEDERVYNLWLEGWEHGYSAFFVGGPDPFLAADSEVADPSYDPACAAAILSAMHTAIDSCRKKFPHPDISGEFASAIPTLKLRRGSVPETGMITHAGETAMQPLSVSSFFLRDGEWDAHASVLAEHLVRSHAKRIRRYLHDPVISGDHSGLCLRDIELLGEFGLPEGSKLTLELHVRGAGARKKVKRLSLGVSRSRRWFISYDKMVDLSRGLHDGISAELIGYLLVNSGLFGKFRANLHPSTGALGREHFIFNDQGLIIGRIALDQVYVAGGQATDHHLAAMRDKSTILHTALLLGQQLGTQLNSFSTKQERAR